MARRRRSTRLLEPVKPPAPVRPPIASSSPKLRRAVDIFVEYQLAAGTWVTTEGVNAQSPALGTLSLEFPPAPDVLSLLIGDCLQNLRSALDHEVFRQSQALKGMYWSGLRHVQFPVHADPKTFPVVRKSVLAGVVPQVADLVESLQPFATRQNHQTLVLGLLHLAARIDRHRLLHVAAAQPKAYGFDRYRPDLSAVEGKLVVRLELIDFVEPRLMNLDIHQFLSAAIDVVDDTITRMVQAESGSPSIS